MRRFSLATLSLSIVTIPAVAFAYYARPSDLLSAASLAGKPLDFSYELHGNYDEYYLSAWMKGATEGKELPELKTDMKVTVDFAYPEGQVRAKVQVRVKNKMLYVMLESLEGSAAEDIAVYAESIRSRQWYSTPLEDLQSQGEEAAGVSEEQGKEILKQVVDAILNMERTADGAGSVYSLKLKRNAATELKKMLASLEEQYPNLRDESIDASSVGELRRLFARTNLHIKVMTDAEDMVRGVKFYLAFAQDGMRLMAQGNASVRSLPVTVRVPVDVELLGEL